MQIKLVGNKTAHEIFGLRLQAAQQKASVQHVEKVSEIQEHDYNARRLFNLFNSKNLSAFKALLESGYHPDMEPNIYGSVLTNICMCSTEDSEKYVDLLLQHGANPNKVNQSKYCPLKGVLYSLGHENTYETRSKIVELLLKHDANPNYPSQELYCGAYAPLHRAVDFSISISKENTKIIELLLQYGASTQTKDKHGHTPLEHLEHDIRNNRMAPYNNPDRYVNYKRIKSILELGYEAHQKLITEQEAELKRQQEEMAQADDMLCGGEGNDELAQFFDSHKPPPLTLEEVKQTEEQRLTKIQESQHHLFSADALNQCKKEARSQHISDTVSSVIECTPQSIQESLMRGKPVGWTNCDKKAQKLNFNLLDSRLKLCESQETQRQHDILKEEIDKHVEKFFKNFLRICELLGFAADGVLTSEQYNLVIEKMEEERAEKIKMLEALDLSGRKVEGYGAIGSHVKMSVMLSNFFDLDNDSFRKKIMEAVAEIKKQKDDQKMRHYTPAGGSGHGWGGSSFANFFGKDYDPTKRSSLSKKESSNSCYSSSTLISFNSRRRSMSAPSSYRRLGRLTTGTVTLEDGQTVSNNKTTWSPSVGYYK